MQHGRSESREARPAGGSSPGIPTGTIFDIRRFSIHDGPGLRTTVFFKGCPLRCLWCHNPESQHRRPERMFWAERCLKCQACIASCAQGALSWDGKQVVTDEQKCTLSGLCVDTCYADARQIAGHNATVDEVMSEIQRDISFYDGSGGGATFSGGEPLLQPAFLLALLRACKASEIHTALDTSGFARWDVLDLVRPFVDLFLYDLKLMDSGRHRKFTGVFNTRILDNLQRLAKLGHNIIVRVPLIPGVNDDLENLRLTAAFTAGLGGLGRVDVLPYHYAAMSKYERLHRTYRLPGLHTPSEERMQEISQVFEGFGLQVNSGG